MSVLAQALDGARYIRQTYGQPGDLLCPVCWQTADEVSSDERGELFHHRGGPVRLNGRLVAVGAGRRYPCRVPSAPTPPKDIATAMAMIREATEASWLG